MGLLFRLLVSTPPFDAATPSLPLTDIRLQMIGSTETNNFLASNHHAETTPSS